MPTKDTKVIVKEIIEINKKVDKLNSWQSKFDFLESIFNNAVKALIIIGLLISYYKKDVVTMLLLIGVSIIIFGVKNKEV